MNRTDTDRGPSRPTALADIVNEPRFPFRTWASENRFAYPAPALPLLERTNSAGEAFLVRGLFKDAAVTMEDGIARTSHGLSLAVERIAGVGPVLVVRAAGRRAVLRVRDVENPLAIRRGGDLVQALIRERRCLLAGYPVIPFALLEVTMDAGECWRQVRTVLSNLPASGR
jgi:hypothetical protein